MFASKQPAAGAKPRTGAPGLSFIGSEVVISGDLATDAQLHVDGRIDGNVRCASLCQGPKGIIAGNIFAEEARLAGTVEGTVSAGTIVDRGDGADPGRRRLRHDQHRGGRRDRGAARPPRRARPRRGCPAGADRDAGLLLAGAGGRGQFARRVRAARFGGCGEPARRGDRLALRRRFRQRPLQPAP